MVRLYLTNTANTRVFRLCIPGASLKLVGSDLGRVERERLLDRLIIAPSERWVVDAYFPEAGEFALEHISQGLTYRLATFEVSPTSKAQPNYSGSSSSSAATRSSWRSAPRLGEELAREPDRVLSLQGDMPGMHMMAHGHGEGTVRQGDEQAGLRSSSGKTRCRSTTPCRRRRPWCGAFGTRVSASTTSHPLGLCTGDRVKIRIINDPASDHPMHHPVHFHGQRFYELEWDGHQTEDLMWKDTVLVPTGKTVDILLECSNPGSWMVHCHIAEHLEAGMMFTFEVRDTARELREAG